MIMMATKTNFLDQVVPKRKCTRKNYTSEFEVIGKTERKYETQREMPVAEAQTRGAKNATSSKNPKVR
jgi:hypothetical protein